MEVKPATYLQQLAYKALMLSAFDYVWMEDINHRRVVAILREGKSDPVSALVAAARQVLANMPDIRKQPFTLADMLIPIVVDLSVLAREAAKVDANYEAVRKAIQILINEPSIQEI